MKRIHDISIAVRSGGLVYPGNPPIAIEPQQAISQGAGANVSSISFGSHTGTHVDAAKHFFDDGETVDQIAPDLLIGPAILIEVDDTLKSVGAADLKHHDLRGYKRVLIRTRNSALLSDPEFHRDYTFIAPDGAEYLVEQGVTLVGVDYLSIEQFHSGHHRTHRTLLEKNVVIVEGLNLSGVNPGEYTLVCLPLRLEGLDGAPARAILIEE
ncbi:MAG TPA: cyclase family protein [Gemmatimonadaceae bacterium]